MVQAQGEYDAAQAALAQASGATAENSTINSSAASQSATNEQSAADAALQGAYAALDDAVHTKADTIFSNPLSTDPTFLPLTIPDAQLVQTIENDRLSLEGLLNNDSSIASDSAAGDTDANIATMIGDAQTVEAFLADIIRAVDDAVPNQQYSATTITAFQTTMTAARSEVVSAVSSLTTVKSAYDGHRQAQRPPRIPRAAARRTVSRPRKRVWRRQPVRWTPRRPRSRRRSYAVLFPAPS